MARNIKPPFTEDEKDKIINCGAFNFTPRKIANVLDGWTVEEIKELKADPNSEFNQLLSRGRDRAEYVLTLQLFDMARAGDLKALEEFENRINTDE